LQWKNARAGIDVTEGSTRTRTTSEDQKWTSVVSSLSFLGVPPCRRVEKYFRGGAYYVIT
jgi:hypothetical protein